MLFKNRKLYVLNFALILALLGGLFGVGPVQASAVIHVKWNASGADNGTSWTDAYTDLQSALSAASSGDEIWVAAGTYKPTTGTDRAATFQLKSDVAIYGGFAGTETARDQRDPSINVTILSGDLNGNDNTNIAHDEPTRGENVLHVVSSSEVGNTTILDGFTITAGNANLDYGTHTAKGGGMWNGNGNSTLTNIIFINNTSLELGGGMFNENDSQPMLTNILFTNNFSEGGGGLANARSSPTLSNVSFITNTASYTGGGMVNILGSSPILEHVSFYWNSAFSFGGGMSSYESTPSVSNSAFHNNMAFGNDHAFHTHDRTPPFGGGMYNFHSHAVIINSTFYNNRAGNVSYPIAGSGIGNQESDPILTHVTIFEGLDGIMNDASHPVVRNSIVWERLSTGNFIAITDVNNSSSTVSDSVIENGFVGGTNIITADPMLGEPVDNGDSTQAIPLLPGSSAIDQANMFYCPATDQRGLSRPQGAGCDMGAYEFLEYTISGNTNIGGVTLDYSEGMTTSDDNGNYSFRAPHNWGGKVTPYKVGYRFTPESRTYTNIQSDQSNQDFSAERVYTISGNVGVRGATLSYEENGVLKMVTALSNGNYSLQVPENWMGTVTPSKANVTFTPASRSYAGVQADQSGENYSAVITVVNQNNIGAGSLRQAITDAVSGATIRFAPALAGQTINLSSQFIINKNLVIDGSGLTPRLEISGNGLSRIFHIEQDLIVTLRSLVLKQGKTQGTTYTSYGGAVFVSRDAQLTIEKVAFVENRAPQGGALYASGFTKVLISESEFLSNSSELVGGAIYLTRPIDLIATKTRFANNSAVSGGAIYLDDSGRGVFEENVFENNTASTSGGAIASYNSPGVGLTFKNNLFSGNAAASVGGAIRIDRLSSAFVILENNTLYGNEASQGGAIYSVASIELRNNTFSNNQVSNGGASVSLAPTGALNKLYNNIFTNGTGGVECLPSTPSASMTGSHNLVEGGAGSCGALPGTISSDPILGPLADNGGSTQTMALLHDSPAIDAGDAANCPATDQRGMTRPQGAACDIGAYESYDGPISPGDTVRVSVDSSGMQGNDLSQESSVSADGRYIAFTSNADNLVSGDIGPAQNVFLRDMQTGTTTLVSVFSSDTQINGTSPSISADGHYIAFQSMNSNYTNYNIFVRDMQAGVATLVSVDASGAQATGYSLNPSISADGRYIAFSSDVANLISGDTNGHVDIFVRDMQTDVTTRVSVDSSGLQANGDSIDPFISTNGRYIAFKSSATNLASGDLNGKEDIFVHDAQTGLTTRVSVASTGAEANDLSGGPSISADGRYVAFASPATNLVPDDTNMQIDVFVHDLQTGNTMRVSTDSSGIQADDDSGSVYPPGGPSISSDGRYIAFQSFATNLAPNDTNGDSDIFVHDLQTGLTTRVSVDSSGAQGVIGGCWFCYYDTLPVSISADGSFVAFTSYAPNLVPDDTNSVSDIFVHRQDILPIPPTPTPTYTPTFTPTSTATYTPTFTPTFTPTSTPTNTFTPTSTPPYSHNPLYLSLTGNQTIGGVASADEDILRFDGTNWSLFFDGSDVGVGSPDLFGFSFIDSDSILMSFSANVTVNGIAATSQDILRFDAASLGSTTSGTWSMYFDGSDIGFDTTAEKIDSVSLLPDGRLLISTTGNPVVAGVTGAKDEDVLAFTPTTLGNTTSGNWSMYFDGSDVGLGETSGEDVDALDVVGGKIYLSTADSFTVNGVAGADEDVFVCVPTSVGDVTACNYSPSLYFDGSTWGLIANDVDAFNLLSVGPVPTFTPSTVPSSAPTPTKTLTPTSTFIPTFTYTPISTNTPTPMPTWIAATPTYTFTPTNTATATNTSGGPTNTPTRTATATFTPTSTSTTIATNTSNASDLIFKDGFESGNLSAWTSNSNDLGDLSVSPSAALIGSQGIQAVIDDANTIFVTDDNPLAEPRYRARFYFDPNSILMASGDAHIIFSSLMGTNTAVLRMEFGQTSGSYQLRARVLLDDGTTWVNTNWFTISDATHSIELDWRAATGVGANNGGLTLWIDGAQQADLTGMDNDTLRTDRVRLGAITGIDVGTSGSYYFDAFESRRQTYIGP